MVTLIIELEGNLQQFISEPLVLNSSLTHLLMSLFQQFPLVLPWKYLQSISDSNLKQNFQKYGLDLEKVKQSYGQQKRDPPITRNFPLLTEKIMWSWYLDNGTATAMQCFESIQNVVKVQRKSE